MTIRAKLYVAILLSVIGPVITIAVALNGMGALGERFDEVHDRSVRSALALDLKFGVTDVNGWETAYGYDDGASRHQFEAAVRAFEADLGRARDTFRRPRERELLRELEAGFARFMELDEEAFAALRAGNRERVRRIFLGPSIERFEEVAASAERLARYEARQARATEAAFDDSREDARRGLIAVALGALLVIVLLLVTAADIARAALERERGAST